MRRREFISAVALLPRRARAAVLKSLSARLSGDGPNAKSDRGPANGASRAELCRGQESQGRFGGQQSERLDAIASELVELRPDAIVTAGTPAVFAARRATTTIPIVMAPVGDPVRYGIVASLAHPGGNITGVMLYRSELGSQGGAASNYAPWRPGQRNGPCYPVLVGSAQLAARALGLEPALFTVRESNETTAAFATMQRNSADAVVVETDGMLISAQPRP